MAADASIFAQYLRPVKSVADYGAEMDASQQNALQLAALKMKAQQDQQGFADEQTFRGLAQQHGNDQNALMRAAMSAGLYGKAQGIQKTIDEQLKAKADREKTGADTRKTDVEIIDKSLATAKTFVNQVQDSQGAAAYLEGLYSDPVLGPLAQRMMPKEQAIANIPQDPQQLLRWKAGHMQITGDKLIDLLRPKTDITNMGAAQSFGATDQFSGQRTQTGSAPITQSADNAATQATSQANNAASVAATVRGQNMTDSRAREGLRLQGERLTLDKSKAVAEGAEKPLNEGQSKALLFGSRMKEADAVFTKMGKLGVTQPGAIKRSAETVGNIAGLGTVFGDVLGDTAGSLTNWTQSDEQQQVEQAQRDFINAALRRESGASISNPEFSNGKKQYFPQPGDGDAVLKQKAQNRSTAIAGILAEVPQNRRELKVPKSEPQTGGASGGWSISRVP